VGTNKIEFAAISHMNMLITQKQMAYKPEFSHAPHRDQNKKEVGLFKLHLLSLVKYLADTKETADAAPGNANDIINLSCS